ncbi:MAG TPA: hypothetical protein VFA20_22825 [Myxococcaceae bacterium]|nr:hypothetical protein [Myxococcaceae bacterium]
MSTTARIRTLSIIALAASLAACDQAATIRGKISDQSGTQQQGLSDTGGLGGSGTVSAATEVRLMQINSDGTLTQMQDSKTAKVDASGQYSVTITSSADHVIIQALDAQGQVVASGLYESVQPGIQTYVAAPLDTETSVEASVLVQMIRRGSSSAQANSVDLRARIDAQVAAAVKASSDPDAKIQALADAAISAQRTEEKSYQQAGLTVTQQSLFTAEAAAAAHLSAALDHGDDAATAYATFFTELQAARAAAGVTEQQQAKAEHCSSASFSATLQARLQASIDGAAVISAAVRQAAALEADASASAVTATLQAAGAAQASVDAAAAAAVALRAALSASTSASASASAWRAYQAAIKGDADVTGSVLGNYLSVSTSTHLIVDSALLASGSAAATLDTTLSTTFEATLSAAGAVDFNVVAASVASAYATYEASVRAQATTLSGFGTKATPALDVMVLASGSISAK